VATGAAYYYFPSKEAIVMAFYWQTHREFDARVARILGGATGLAARLEALVFAKLVQLRPYRDFLGALFRAAGDPASPLSPFSAETREIREESIAHYRAAVEGSDTRLPEDLSEHLPRMLWLYQLGILLFWIYDRSARQARTDRLLRGTSELIATAVKLSRFRILKPFRASVISLLESVTEAP
jgi:AcrR family transcriptional regulator